MTKDQFLQWVRDMTTVGKLPAALLAEGLQEAARIWDSMKEPLIRTAWEPLKIWYEEQQT